MNWLRKRLYMILASITILMGMLGMHYLHDVYGGIKGHPPHCAPITMSTVIIVYTFALIGMMISVVAYISVRHKTSLPFAALLGCFLNIIVFAIWLFWNINENLLPYDEFCLRVFGM